MDIMRPPIEQQVAPAPWLVAQIAIDVPALIKEAIRQQPNGSVDEIAGQLASWGAQVSGVIISMWLRKLNERREPPKNVHEH